PAVYSIEDARALWSRGAISPRAYFWKDGMPDWRPVSELFAGSAGTTAARGFAGDPRRRTLFVLVMMWVSLGLNGVAVLTESILWATGRLPSNPEEFTAADRVQAVIGLLQMFVFVITAIAFLIWFHRAHRNAAHLGAKGLTFTPAWAVGWFFIPIMNWW